MARKKSSKKGTAKPMIYSELDATITIIHDTNSLVMSKHHFQNLVYYLMKQKFDVSKLGKLANKYVNAFEWILANLYRVAGIQLYSDCEIRLNLLPSEIKNGKKCLFLMEDDNIEDRDFDIVLYAFLFDLIYGPSKGVVS